MPQLVQECRSALFEENCMFPEAFRARFPASQDRSISWIHNLHQLWVQTFRLSDDSAAKRGVGWLQPASNEVKELHHLGWIVVICECRYSCRADTLHRSQHGLQSNSWGCRTFFANMFSRVLGCSRTLLGVHKLKGPCVPGPERKLRHIWRNFLESQHPVCNCGARFQ